MKNGLKRPHLDYQQIDHVFTTWHFPETLKASMGPVQNASTYKAVNKNVILWKNSLGSCTKNVVLKEF